MIKLAVDGGQPVRSETLSYGSQSIDEGDVEAVVEVLHSNWLTTGRMVERFEQLFAEATGAREAVTLSNGTAALHAAVAAAGIGPGDEVIVPPMTFAATANAVVFQGGRPVFADVDPGTLLLDPSMAEQAITPRTRAIIPVDFAGQPCRYDELAKLAEGHGLVLIADACHSLGGVYRGRPVGSLADQSCFSFHPVKPITTGEGGMVSTDDPDRAEWLRSFRNHGIDTDFRQREATGAWTYQMVRLGYNYRLTDIQCALGLSQLRRLSEFLRRRREIAARYDTAFQELPAITPLKIRADVTHAYHLYVVRLKPDGLRVGRREIFQALRAERIGVAVHYMPVHVHPFYRERFGIGPGLCPEAERAYEEILTLPLFPGMTDQDVSDVVEAVEKVLGAYAA